MINGTEHSGINAGMVILLGVYGTDTDADAAGLANKIFGLRIFEDENGKMNLSVSDIGGKILVISTFTVCADVSKGRRPSFSVAAQAEYAEKLYSEFVSYLSDKADVKTGVFGADMQVEIINDGPVTIIADSAELMKKE